MLGLLPKNKVAQFDIQRGEHVLTVEFTPRDKGRVDGEELDCPRWDFTAKAINQFGNPDLHFYRKEGVFVNGVKYPGNAASAGLQGQDIILKIGDVDVKTLEDLQKIHTESIENLSTSHRKVVTVLRNGLMRQVVLDFSRDHSK